MPSKTRVKICGLTRPEAVSAAVDAGAAYIGFNFVTRSVRYVPPDAARDLAIDIPPGVAKVALSLNADDAELDALTATVPLDMLQLHGSESPERVQAVRARYGLPVIKALGVRDADDLAQIERYAGVADQLLIDAKPPRSGDLPGGTGLTFDWTLIAGRRWPVPWMLAGGLTPDNVAEAVRVTGTAQVDVASGVESAPGQKDAELMRAFVQAAQSL